MAFTHKVLGLIFFLIILPRFWIIFNSSYAFYSDDAIYTALARSLIEGKWQYVFHPTWPPLYPAITAALALLIPNLEFASRLVAVTFGTAIAIPLFYLLRQTMSLSVALSFMFAILLFTPILKISLLPLSDSLAIYLTILGLVLVFFAFVRLRMKFLLFSSFIFGLVYLTRTEGTMFFTLTLIYLIFYAIFKCRTRLFFLTILSFIGIFFFTISPYVVATRLQIGEWSLSQKFSAQIQQGHAFAVNKNGTTWAQEVTATFSPNYQSPYFKNGLDFINNRFLFLMQQYPEKQLKWQKVFVSIFPVWTLPLILLGSSSLSKKYRWPVIYLIFIMAAAIPMTIFSTPVQDIRYLAWTIPIFLYFFYLGIGRLIPKKFIAVTAFAAVLLFPGASLDNLVNPKGIAADFTQNYYKSELKSAGDWIKHHTLHPSPKIMMRHEGVEFYSGGETVYTPQLAQNQVLLYAKKNKVDYLVAWDEELAMDTELASLLDDQITHPGLQKVYAVTGRGKIIIYSLIK